METGDTLITLFPLSHINFYAMAVTEVRILVVLKNDSSSSAELQEEDVCQAW